MQRAEKGEMAAVVGEGSLRGMRVAAKLADSPGSAPGFFNPKRRVGRDFVVLSVARWLAKQSELDKHRRRGWTRPARLLDAMCASGIQGLRVVSEAPLIAKEANGAETLDLLVVLNDVDSDAADLAVTNVQQLISSNNAAELKVDITRRVAQALMHEESFDVCVLDPFGSVVPFLDAALARAPHEGLLEVCATDLGALYGARPAVTLRHYGAKIAHKRPPCYKERGVRLLLAAVAQAAGRQGRGIEAVMSVSTEHFVLVSVRVIRGARGADETAQQLQKLRICRSCSACTFSPGVPQCGCESKDGAGADAREEGPFWVGAMHDAEDVAAIAAMADLPAAAEVIADETRTLLATLKEEALVQGIFYRRPQGVVAAGTRTPKLAHVIAELQRRGHAVARTHFDDFALKTDASVHDFELAVNGAADEQWPSSGSKH